ncbi:MAG: DNA ligase (NAD+) [Fusobacteria bacterium]|nr:MAG: DNA ligase (NAD+) [Fusobacteriota bacterium]KAF0227883.1 MAG: DNA ligase [Fusobacteriota bacterium]
MNIKEIKLRIEELRKILEKANADYYEKDMPTITDSEYDQYMKELLQLEKDNPELISQDSPTKIVGGKVSEKFHSYRHRYPLLSLGNAFSYEDLRTFDNRVKKALNKADVEYIAELKIDGLSIALIFKDGLLIVGATRGDGDSGENVTHNILKVEDIPKTIDVAGEFEVRGEVFMDNKTFDDLNETRLNEGLPLFRNPRNGAAGSIRQLNSDVTRERHLKSFIYEITYSNVLDYKKQSDAIKLLNNNGFNTNERFVLGNIEDIIEFCEKLVVERNNLEYGIDGVVVKVNSLADQIEMGYTEKSPRWAIAFKFPPEQKETIVENITISVGRTGVLTPMAELKETLIGGSMVKRATLHNEDYILEKDIRVGDTIVLQKAGDVIPEVVRVIVEKRPYYSEVFKFPVVCPVCGSEVIKLDASIKCTGELYCPAQLIKGLIHFVSRDAMNIDGLGEKYIEYFVKEGLISTPVDIYKLTKDDISVLEGLGEKSANNIIEAIETSKTRGLGPLIYGFGIPLIGNKGAKILAKNFKTVDRLMAATSEELLAIETVGDKMADSLLTFFKEKRNLEIITDLKYLGIVMEDDTKNLSEDLVGKTFVITGSFPGYDRKELTNLVELHGGKASSSVSKKTSFVLAGNEPGSKLTKARELGVDVIEIKEFLKKIGERQVEDGYNN